MSEMKTNKQTEVAQDTQDISLLLYMLKTSPCLIVLFNISL